MSPSNKILKIEAPDAVSEISVLNGNNERIEKVIGRNLEKALDPGLYKVRVRVGSALSEQLVSLDQDREVTFTADQLKFPTPIPLQGTALSHEYHISAAIEASAEAPIDVGLGTGASLLIFSRNWSADANADDPPMAGLTLCDAYGDHLLRLEEHAKFSRGGDICGDSSIAVEPGAYRLRVTLQDGTASERVLIAVQGWQTLIFMLTKASSGACRADLGNGEIMMSRSGQKFDPNGRGERAAVLARYALTQNRKVADAIYDELLTLKFGDPVLGLLAAHLLARDKPEDQAKRSIVIDNLKALLKPDHPDVLALRLLDPAEQDKSDPMVYKDPPMLRASWDVVTAATINHKIDILNDSLAESIAGHVLPNVPWLVWDAHEGVGPTELNQKKLVQLAYFLQGLAGTGFLMEPWASVIRQAVHVLATAEPQTFESSVLAKVPSHEEAIKLSPATKTDLTRALGVTANVLDSMLAKIGL
jgi:hypothetical protein